MYCRVVINIVCIFQLIGWIESGRIIGGFEAEIEHYPYQASIRHRNENHCGGAIIDEWHVLTAAHCIGNVLVPPFKDVTVNTGTGSTDTEGNVHKIEYIVPHPEYNLQNSHKHDIAVITLTEPIKFDDYQQKINLPSRDVLGGERAVITGWGYTSVEDYKTPVQLQTAEMVLMRTAECRRRLSPFRVFDEQVCAFQKDGIGSCMGDSGGPLVADGELVGITSWGVPCAKGYPDVYTKVYAYINFIDYVLKGYKKF